mgnify:CR=1 FL=1
MKPDPKTKSEYFYFETYSTRWRDNDSYGHMNNVVYYEFADSLVNNWLRSSGALNVPNSKVIGLVAETKCNYFVPLAYPFPVTCGLALSHKGNSSVTFNVGLFEAKSEKTAAYISFVHVYVQSGSYLPTKLPESLEEALKKLT